MASAPSPASPRFFAAPSDFRAWLERHYTTERELWVGFYKVASGRGGMVYRQALDEALCFGWIDGLLRSLDDQSYAQRFTPRRKDSPWSAVNTKRVRELIAEGRMHPAGTAVFEARDTRRRTLYSFEQGEIRLAPEFARRLKADRAARAFFEKQPPSYRRVATWWVMSAKKEDTRARRFTTLLEDSAAGRRIGVATPGGKRPAPAEQASAVGRKAATPVAKRPQAPPAKRAASGAARRSRS